MEVSVIIPIYNTGERLSIMLDSAVRQSFSKSFEIICVNDCTSDVRTLEILSDYDKKYGLIKRIDLPNNVGLANARNTGLKSAVGKFVVFWDSDDVVALDALQRYYDTIIEAEADVCYGSVSVIKSDSDSAMHQLYILAARDFNDDFGSKTNLKNLSDDWLLYNCDGAWNKMVRRSFLVDNYIDFYPVLTDEDTYYSLMVSILSDKVCFLDSIPVYYYRFNDDGLLSNQNPVDAFIGIMKAIERIDKLIDETLFTQIFVCLMQNMYYLISIARERRLQIECYRLFIRFLDDNAGKIKIHSVRYRLLYERFIANPDNMEWIFEEKTFDAQFEKNIGLIRDAIGNRTRVILWGAGKRGLAFLRLCKRDSIELFALCDSNMNNDLEHEIILKYGVNVIESNKAIEQADLLLATNDIVYDFLKKKTTTCIINLQDYSNL